MDVSSTLEFGGKRVPLLLQTEAAECGLACLAMVSGWHGYRIDMASLRARFSLSLKGANMAQLISYADNLKLDARAVRLEMDEMRELATPCILHWDLNHFVVLVRVQRNRVLLHDPAIGVRRLPFTEVSKHFTGVALELTPTIHFRPANEMRRVSIASLMGRVVGLWPSMGLVFGMALALEAFALASPIFNQWVVDEALVSADRNLLNALLWGFALMLIIQTSISLARGWTLMYISTHLNLQWVSNVFTHLLRLPVAWFEKRHLGDVVSRFGSINAIQHTLTSGFVETILDGLRLRPHCR
jgi:ATP-binding cassette subfamily B protein RaxB